MAPATKDVRFVVQGFEDAIGYEGKALLEDQKARVEFVQHDFFIEQLVRGANIDFLRWILHDWGDEYAVHIL